MLLLSNGDKLPASQATMAGMSSQAHAIPVLLGSGDRRDGGDRQSQVMRDEHIHLSPRMRNQRRRKYIMEGQFSWAGWKRHWTPMYVGSTDFGTVEPKMELIAPSKTSAFQAEIPFIRVCFFPNNRVFPHYLNDPIQKG